VSFTLVTPFYYVDIKLHQGVDMELVLILGIGVVLWYFGSTIARGAETVNNLADTRLEDMEAEQLIVSAKRRAKVTRQAKKMAEKGEVSLNNKELIELLKGGKK
jgi:hypothetical protein